MTKEPSLVCEIKETVEQGTNQRLTEVTLKDFPPGSILGFKSSLFEDQEMSFKQLLRCLEDNESLQKAMTSCNLLALNELLYRCEEEERVSCGYRSAKCDIV